MLFLSYTQHDHECKRNLYWHAAHWQEYTSSKKTITMSSVIFLQYGLIGFGILVIIVLGIAIYTLIRYGLHLLLQTQRLSEPILPPLLGFIRGFIVIVVILASLHQAGVQVTSIWAAVISAAALLAGGFIALSSLISNLLCTVLLLVFMPFRIGDEIELIEATRTGEGLRGRVVGLNLFFASLQNATADGDRTSIIRIPNTTFFQKTIRQWRASEYGTADK